VYQGTTSVVPNIGNLKPGFSPCKIRESAGAEAQS